MPILANDQSVDGKQRMWQPVPSSPTLNNGDAINLNSGPLADGTNPNNLPQPAESTPPTSCPPGETCDGNGGVGGGGGSPGNVPNPIPSTSTSMSILPTAFPTNTIDAGHNGNSKKSNDTGINSLGAKVGLGVGIPILLILIGVAIFFVLRKKKQLAREHGDTTEKMITSPSDKQAGSILLTNNEHDNPHLAGSGVSGYGMEQGGSSVVSGSPHPGAVGGGAVPYGAAGVAGAVVPLQGNGKQREREDEIDRPVSPVHPGDDYLLQDGDRQTHSRLAGGSGTADANVEDDGEMQWILEEERKARERREAQGRLPTGR